MRLLLDGAAFQNAHQRGIQRYFTELLARLPAEADIRIALSAGARAPLPPRATPVRTDLGLCAVLPRRARPIVQRLVATPLSRRLARSCEVFHATYYTRSPAASLPSVLTVYDMIAERFGDSFPSLTADREIDRKRAAILAADRIITISYHAAAELRSIYPEVAGRIMRALEEPLDLLRCRRRLQRAAEANLFLSHPLEQFAVQVGDALGA